MSRRTYYKPDITNSILDTFYLYGKSAKSKRTIQMVLNRNDCVDLIFQMKRHLRKLKRIEDRLGEKVS